MRRSWAMLGGTVLACTLLVFTGLASAVLTAAPAQAATESEFLIAIVADEGPAPVSGSVQSFDAVLSSGGATVGGAPVTLTARPYGATSFAAIGHGTTAADGSVLISARLALTSQLQWVFSGDGSHAATSSRPYVRTVGSRVRARAADTTLARHQAVVVNGRSLPAKPGYQVSLWRGNVPCFCEGPRSVRIAVARIRPDGTFRLSARFVHRGTRQLYVQVNGGGGTTTGYSTYLRIHVR